MRLRTGFVSNSSSASFILDKRYLTPEQIGKIIAWLSGAEGEDEDVYEYWNFSQDNDFIRGFTTMDNDYFSNYLKELDINQKAIVSWDGD